MLSASVEVRVRYGETDKMGIVYHANYLTWFEIARIELLDSIGCPYKSLEETDFFLPVLSCRVDFRRPAHFDDRLRIVVRIDESSSVRIKADYEVFRDDDLLATGQTTHAFVSGEGKVVRPPASFLERVRQSVEKPEQELGG
ncbi:MAG: acyl-CoA thioesterase [Opitutae bacterium]|jgi:acyl-CoA thioester hydrolase|nr:acyl-CoA thioesterase [Opitutae bacterium]